MPLLETKGAASAQGFGLTIGGAAITFIENVFSCFLYTGTGATQTITNDIDLSTKGGLVWIKSRSDVRAHRLTDTARGATIGLTSVSSAAQVTQATGLTAFNTTGFTVGADADYNLSASNFVSWTFREQPKFFDIVTYTGNGANRTIAHNLGSVPGCMIVKRTDTAEDWAVYHRSLANTQYLVLNTSAAAVTGATWWNSTTPTSSVFSVGTSNNVNASAGTYVAYLFAHDSGGFGLTGTNNVISCGSFTADGSGNATVSLGYEPQWIMLKLYTGGTSDWYIFDNMRGWWNSTGDALLLANLTDAETTATQFGTPDATGFSVANLSATSSYIYIAIRRGPMKVPTDATKVFSPVADTGTSAAKSISAGFTVDAGIRIDRQKLAWTPNTMYDKLQGALVYMNTNATTDNIDFTPFFTSFDQAGITVTNSGFNSNTTTYINYFFQRAPNFFDEVCYTGTGIATTLTHNLTVAPELIIVKKRSAASTTGWLVGTTALGYANKVYLNLTNASAADSTAFNSTAPTTSVFSVGTNTDSNASAATYVAYLFATCAGVSKVGSYTGNGSTQTINCGFGAGGARFVLIKRTDTTGDWYAYDTARGMTTLTDPYLLLNSTAAEVATLGSVTTVSTGFALNSAILAAINVNAGSYIFFAVA